MNRLLQACVATGVFAVVAAPAMATIDRGDTGNGELFLTLIDQTAQRSSVLGLNLHLSDVLPAVLEPQSGTILSFDVSSQINALLGAGATTANLTYSVVAADSQPSSATETRFGRQFAVTGSTVGAGPNTAFSNNPLRIATNAADGIASAVGANDGVVATPSD